MLILLDIDGVLADCSHRLHYLKDKNYDKFYSAEEILNDNPIRSGLDLLYELFPHNKVVLVTGRPYRTQEATMAWLKREFRDDFEPEMIMRKDHDFRPSDVLKAEMIKEFTDGMEGETILFIDDDPKNVKAVENACRVQGVIFGSSRLGL